MYTGPMKNNHVLTVRWAPGSTPGDVRHQYLSRGKWVPIAMAEVEKYMRSGVIVHWNPTGSENKGIIPGPVEVWTTLVRSSHQT